MSLKQYISVSPEVQFGKPVFKGTRVTVESLFLHLEQGVSLPEFLEDFPGVSKEQAEAVLETTAQLFQSTKWQQLNEIIA